MLTREVTQQINNFVAQKPRTIQEIAQHINKNWRTAESYVLKIQQQQGTLSTRTFRSGTRGALKIAYWNLVNKNQSSFQEMLFQKIKGSPNKKDFSAFDIYQYLDEDKRSCFLERQEKNLNVKQDLIPTISSAVEQVLIFSGDLSWSQACQNKIPLLKAFENLAEKNIPVKIIANVDLNSLKNVQEMLNINHRFGKNLIEIRHAQQPLRAFIVDNNIARIKERYFLKSVSTEKYLFYSIMDSDWIDWLKKLFWHFFSTAISAEKRIKDIESIRKM